MKHKNFGYFYTKISKILMRLKTKILKGQLDIQRKNFNSDTKLNRCYIEQDFNFNECMWKSGFEIAGAELTTYFHIIWSISVSIFFLKHAFVFSQFVIIPETSVLELTGNWMFSSWDLTFWIKWNIWLQYEQNRCQLCIDFFLQKLFHF